MIWLSWRQVRTQVLVVYALVLAAVITLALTGPRLAHLASRATNVYDLLTPHDRLLFNAGLAVVAVAPALIGAFWGAPLVARELETGTHRLVWNQSVTRTRWLATRLGVGALATVIAVGALSLAVTWWAKPLDGSTSSRQGNLPSRLTPISFAMRGIVPVGYAVFALVLGVAVGLLLRRTVPAMAVTLAVYVCVQVAVPLWIRPHLLPPTSASISYSPSTFDGIEANPGQPLRISVHTPHHGDWILQDTTWNARGEPSTLPSWFTSCLPGPPPPGQEKSSVDSRGDLDRCLARLTGEGYRQHVVYQPASRFWPLQWAETGLYVGASAALAGCCFWWIRRRLS
jgi:hypothetical protein